MGSLCRDAGQGGHAMGEVAFAVGDGLLVAHSDVDVAVTRELHELFRRRSADRGHGGGEVAQVVEAEVGASDLVAGLVEAVAGMLLLAGALVEARAVAMDLPRGERLALIAWEHQRVRSGRGEDRQVLADVLGEVRWQVDAPVPGGGLRRGDESLPTDSDGGLLNGDGPFGEVDVAAPQGGEFAEPQSAPRGEQDQ